MSTQVGTTATPEPVQVPILDKLKGFNTLLEGPAGTGKTHSIGTLIDTGLEVFYLDCESGLETLQRYYAEQDKDIPDNFHWHIVESPKASTKTLMDQAKRVNTLTYDILTKAIDPDRSKYDQFIKILAALNKFIDDRTGVDYGDVGTWKANRVIVIDSLTALSAASMTNVVGGRPARGMNDYQVAQIQLINFLRLLCTDCRAHFVLLGHVERETDLVLGGVKLTVASVGKAQNAIIPTLFSDVVLTVRNGEKFYWDTASQTADTKVRYLPIKPEIKPSFQVIVDKWQKYNGIKIADIIAGKVSEES